MVWNNHKNITIALLTQLVLGGCSSELDRCIEANLPQLTDEEVIKKKVGDDFAIFYAENDKKELELDKWDNLNNPINKRITSEEFKKDPLIYDRYADKWSEKNDVISEWYFKETDSLFKRFETEEYKQKAVQEYNDGREEVARKACNKQGIY